MSIVRTIELRKWLILAKYAIQYLFSEKKLKCHMTSVHEGAMIECDLRQKIFTTNYKLKKKTTPYT